MTDKDIADVVANFNTNPGRKAKSKANIDYKQAANNSNFLITINPNISYRALDTDAKRIEIATKLKNISEFLKIKLSQGVLCKPKGVGSKTKWRPPALISFHSEIEQGQMKGFLHIHCLVKFNGTCHIDLANLNRLLKHAFNRAVHCQVKFYQDSSIALQAYLKKTHARLNDVSSDVVSSVNTSDVSSEVRDTTTINEVKELVSIRSQAPKSQVFVKHTTYKLKKIE